MKTSEIIRRAKDCRHFADLVAEDEAEFDNLVRYVRADSKGYTHERNEAYQAISDKTRKRVEGGDD